MARVLLVYSTVDGHTREICERLKKTIEGHGHQVTGSELTPSSDIDVDSCDALA